MKETHKNIIEAAKVGLRIIPLYPGETGEGKSPGKGWPDTPYTLAPDLSKFPGNYGIALDADIVVADIDPRNGGEKSWKKLQKDIGINLAKTCGFVVKTGGGGGHFYFRKPFGFHIFEQLRDKYPGIEMKTMGRQVVGPGSQNFKTKKFYEVIRGSWDKINDIPHEVLEIYKRVYKAIALTKGLKDFNDSEDNIEFVRSVLTDHPPAIEGQNGDDTTFKAVCKCVEYGLSPQATLDLMIEYNERCEPPWELLALEKKVHNGYRYAQNAMGSKDPTLDYENLAEKEKTKEKKLPSEEGIEYKEVATKNFTEELKENWVFVLGVKRFVNATNMMELDPEQFDMHFARLAMKQKPSKVALMSAGLRRVNWQTYAPGKDLLVFEDGEQRLNMWRPSGLIAIPGDPAPFLEFIDYMVGADRAWILHDYISFLVRNPGQKVLWVPLIKGAPGIGKSILGRCIESLLGSHNVRRPTNAQLHEQFTGFMKNCQFAVVEELMAVGRVQLLNKLKDLITEPYIDIREMYKNTYKIPNRVNFMMFTNHDDSLVIPPDDRRFAVLYSQAKPREKEYYVKMVGWMQNNAHVLLDYYLHEHQQNAAFDAKGHAPWTKDKDTLVALGRDPIEAQLLDWKADHDGAMFGRFANLAQILRDIKAAGYKNISVAKLAIHMRACGFKHIGRAQGKTVGRVNLWLIRPEAPHPVNEPWESLSPAKAVAIYEDDIQRERKKSDEATKNAFEQI